MKTLHKKTVRINKPRLVVISLVIAVMTLSPFDVFAKKEATYDPTYFGQNDILMYSPKDVGCTSDGGANTGATGDNNKQKIWNYFIQHGLIAEQAAGILGNIQSVSGNTFSPTYNEAGKDFNDPVTNDKDSKKTNGGYGIAQWRGDQRTKVVDALKAAQPDLMTKYYTVDYSSPQSYTGEGDGFVPKNASTSKIMPVEDNDKLLIVELKFLVDEMTSRALHDPAIKKGYGVASDKEWAILGKQKTVADASNIWVYSYEIPPNDIDATSLVRELKGNDLLKEYGDPSNTTSACVVSGGLAVHPIADGDRVNEGYGGPRDEPLASVRCGGIVWHNGYDLNGKEDVTPVLAAMEGSVTKIDYANPSLDTVSITHPNGFVIRYMHMNKGHIKVNVGDTVTTGQVIGEVGSGNGHYGAHLHIEIDVTGNTNPQVAELHANSCGIKSVNPNLFFKIFGVTLCNTDNCDNKITEL